MAVKFSSSFQSQTSTFSISNTSFHQAERALKNLKHTKEWKRFGIHPCESNSFYPLSSLRSLYNQYETTTDENTVEIRFENAAQEETLERSEHSGDNTFRAHEIELAYVQGQQERRILEDSPKESNPGLLNNSGEEDHEEASEEQTN